MVQSVSVDYQNRVFLNLSQFKDDSTAIKHYNAFKEQNNLSDSIIVAQSNLSHQGGVGTKDIVFNSPERIREIETKAKNCDTYKKLTIGLSATTAYNFAMDRIAAHATRKVANGLTETLNVSMKNGFQVTGGSIPKWGAGIAVSAALLDGFADVRDTYKATNGDIMATTKTFLSEATINGAAAYCSIKGQKFGYTLGSYFGTPGKVVGTIAGGVGGWWVGSELGEGAVDVVGDWFEGDGEGEGGGE